MPPLVWLGFVVFVLLAMAIDLGLYQKRHHGMTTRAALTWVGVWTSMALIFNAGIYWRLGAQAAEEFFAGYLLEQSLSVDNLFVFVLVFSHFKTPRDEQHRVLVWGIIGAMCLRAIMILAGTELVKRAEWVMVIFAAILIVSGFKLLFKGDEEDDDPSDGWVVRAARRVVPVIDGYRGHAFFVVEDGKRKATLLFLVLVVIEASDVIFAVDSIPAIFGITRDPFIVFTSNVFAILGLRSLFFVIEAAIQKLRYLKTGLAFILCFIGVKMTLPFLHHVGVHWAPEWLPGWKVPTSASLAVIVVTLGSTAALSILKAPRPSAPAGDDALRRSASARLPVPAAEAPGAAAPGDAAPPTPTPAPEVTP